MQCIEIIVDSTGKSEIQTRGFVGATCRAASHFLERALGQATHQQITPEYYLAGSALEVTQAERTESD